MRVISQDGTIDMPYEEVIIQRFKSKIYFLNKNLTGVEPLNDDSDVDMAVEKLSKIFGIVKLCRCCVLEKDMDEILTKSLDYIEDEMETARTFKVDAKRSDKRQA